VTWLFGVGLGLLALFPGLHYALVMAWAAPWLVQRFGLPDTLLCLLTAFGCAKGMHTLAVVYHPVAADQIASASPAQRLAHAGRGRLATRVMGTGLWIATLWVCAGFLLLAGLDRITGTGSGWWLRRAIDMRAWMWPVIIGWAGFTVWRSPHKLGTLVTMGACGLVGYWALWGSALLGNSHVLTPLLSGIFALPVLWQSFWQRGGRRPERGDDAEDEALDPSAPLVGAGIGLASVGLPGIGASSLVSVFEGVLGTDVSYMYLSQIAESSGEIGALMIGLLGLAERSATSAMLGQTLLEHGLSWEPGPGFLWTGLLHVVGGVWAGLQLVRLLGPGYRWLVHAVPMKLQALVVGAWVVRSIWEHTSFQGLSLALAGMLIVLGARQFRIPNQALFMCLVAPMACSAWGMKL